MVVLQGISLTIKTHNDDLGQGTVAHVFVKNRSNTSATPESATTFIANHIAFEYYESALPVFGPYQINPYLGRAENITKGARLPDPSTFQVDVKLRSQPIPFDEVVLPVVNIHILPEYGLTGDRWIFSYTITFTFSDQQDQQNQKSFTFSSDNDGVTGIILSENIRDYSGICTENPFNPLPALVKPDDGGALLTGIDLEFRPHSDDDRNSDTVLNVHILNRLSASSSQDLAIGLDLFKGATMDSGVFQMVFINNAAAQYPLASNTIRLRDIVLPVITINIVPHTQDRWVFDYTIKYKFSNGHSFSSSSLGIILDQDNHKHTSVYQGDPFPTVTPPSRPQLSPVPADQALPPEKRISLSFLQKKLDEFINYRQPGNLQNPPLKKLRLDNTGLFGSAEPDSYVDVLSIEADPPRPGTILPPDYREGVRWKSSPSSLGQKPEFYLSDINCTSATANIDTSSPTPITINLGFETGGPQEIIGALGMDFSTLTIRVGLTLDVTDGKIDVMSWVDDIDPKKRVVTPLAGGLYRVQAHFLGQAIDVTVPNPEGFYNDFLDPLLDLKVAHVVLEGSAGAGFLQKYLRGKAVEQLAGLRDSANAVVNSWLLGGVLQQDGQDGCRVTGRRIEGDDLVIAYTGPAKIFVTPAPADWPAGQNFSQGALANIDHIVVLTMENRSFDHMLGYLSLPVAKNGMARSDVDGLKGNESNPFKGSPCPSFALLPGDTIFAPDPPHDPEPVERAINGGKMDGFVRSYAEESGDNVAPRIMGYHTGANVPVYDALARDFAISHRWFASHPGPTFCNRFYEMTGRLNIGPDGFWENTNRTVRPVFTKTIFDYLSDAGVSWNYFEHHYCFIRFFQKYTFNNTKIAAFTDPVNGFLALAKAGKLPSVSFIDPHYVELPPDGSCDGPPADIKEGQALVKRVVEAVVSSPNWSKTMLLIVYDEHGGFFDHVPPPPAVKVSPDSAIATLGLRVPAFIISPWVNAGAVFGHDGPLGPGGGDKSTKTHLAPQDKISTLVPLHFDHTSILKTIAKRFLSNNPPYMGARYAAASDLSPVLSSTMRTSQFLPFISYNLLFGSSQKRLDVPGGNAVPGLHLWQYDANATPAQEFSFEDAGGGFVYIRTHTGNLYVTVDAQPAAPNQPLGVKEDLKYTAATGNPDCQRWKLSVTGAHVPNQPTGFTISNAAFPGKVLQPAGLSSGSQAAIVLGDPAGPSLVDALKTVWQVTSPLLPGYQGGQNL